MESSFSEQFQTLIRKSSTTAHAYLCDGDASAAMIWDDATHITIRLALKRDEIWLFAGSGTLVRFIAASDGEFDHEGIAQVISQILRGEATEFFGIARADADDDMVATGYEIGLPGGFAGGLSNRQARFRTRLAGPLAGANRAIFE